LSAAFDLDLFSIRIGEEHSRISVIFGDRGKQSRFEIFTGVVKSVNHRVHGETRGKAGTLVKGGVKIGQWGGGKVGQGST
jgi:hypothetical protein